MYIYINNNKEDYKDMGFVICHLSYAMCVCSFFSVFLEHVFLRVFVLSFSLSLSLSLSLSVCVCVYSFENVVAFPYCTHPLSFILDDSFLCVLMFGCILLLT